MRPAKQMKFDPIKLAKSIPVVALRNRALDVALTVGIPFNRWLGLKVEVLTPHSVVVKSPPRVLRRNHVGSAHACALALMGEFPAGLLIAQNFSVEEYRVIIQQLHVDYEKQGRGVLRSHAKSPLPSWPEPNEKGEVWVDLLSEITNEKDELVARASTRWQIKKWTDVKNQASAL